MKKKLVSVLLAATLSLSLMACGAADSGTTTDSAKATEEQTAATGETDKSEQKNEEVVDITLTFPILSSVPEDLQKVQDKLTEIAMEKYNCSITLEPLAFGDYISQAPLMLTGGNDVDLMIHFDPITNYSSMVSKGQIQNITDLLNEYAPDVLATVGEDYLAACRVDGQLYGVPTMHDLATGYGVVMRRDLLEKYNIDVSGVKTLDDLDAVFEVIKENEPDIAPMFAGGAAMNPADAIMKASVDTLGDGYGVLMDMGQSDTVTDYFETQEYTDYVNKVYEWNQKGYLLADSDSITDTYSTLFKADKIFAAFMTCKPGQVQQDERNTGKDLAFVQISDTLSMTTLVNGIQWVIPVGAEHPDRAVQILNLLYTDADFLNLLNYGIEGEHYVVKDNGQIALPDGVTADTSKFNWSIGYESGNEFICYTWESDDPDLWNQTKKFNDQAVKSSAMGFTFDNSNVSTELTALANVSAKYRVGLENGTLDPKEYAGKFVEELKNAGLDTVIAEKQKQLDEWKANK